jgi:hypothetical protein
MAEAFSKITYKQVVKNHHPYLKELDYVMQQAFNCSRQSNIRKLLKAEVKKIKNYLNTNDQTDLVSHLEYQFLKIITSKIIYINNNIFKNDNAPMFETFSMETSHILGTIINTFELYNETSKKIKQDIAALKKLKYDYRLLEANMNRYVFKLNQYKDSGVSNKHKVFDAGERENIAELTSNIINYLRAMYDMRKQIIDLHKRMRGTRIHFWSNVSNMLGNMGSGENVKYINQKLKKLKNEVKALDNRFKKNNVISEEISRKLKDIMSEEFKSSLEESDNGSKNIQNHFEALKSLENQIPQLKTKLHN